MKRTMVGMPFADPKIMFGKRVRALREKLGMTQEELAHRAHLHRNYVSLLERGHRGISLNTILEVAKALGVKPAKLFNW
jgi:XRE family transcriptional regulator, regulator of sulfur utilization